MCAHVIVPENVKHVHRILRVLRAMQISEPAAFQSREQVPFDGEIFSPRKD